MKMEKKFAHPAKVAVDLKHLPPIDPAQIMSSSFSSSSSSAFDSKGKFNKSNPRRTSVFKVKASPNQGIKGVEPDEAARESSNSASTMNASNSKKVEEASSTLTCKKKGKKKKASGNKISLIDYADEGVKQGTARSNLYEFCAAKHWKRPIFECCKEEGPGHQRLFTFKAIVETAAASAIIIECIGAPRSNKKMAADHAAEGILWYLKQESLGCAMKNQ